MCSKNIEYDIADEFTAYPAGRYLSDGPGSGEAFRKELKSLLDKGYKIRLIMDNAFGYGSSFLEEAFGGLIREEGLSSEKLLNQIEFITGDENLIIEIENYIKDASKLNGTSSLHHIK